MGKQPSKVSPFCTDDVSLSMLITIPPSLSFLDPYALYGFSLRTSTRRLGDRIVLNILAVPSSALFSLMLSRIFWNFRIFSNFLLTIAITVGTTLGLIFTFNIFSSSSLNPWYLSDFSHSFFLSFLPYLLMLYLSPVLISNSLIPLP